MYTTAGRGDPGGVERARWISGSRGSSAGIGDFADDKARLSKELTVFRLNVVLDDYLRVYKRT